jgi:hypothetical protein
MKINCCIKGPTYTATEKQASRLPRMFLFLFLHYLNILTKYTRAIRKVTSIHFWQLMWEWGRAHACEVASHDSLPRKPSRNWSIACSCLLLSELWCVLWLIIPPAAVYGQNVMSEGTVRQWRRMFKDGWTNVHDEERSGRPTVVSDDLVQSVDQNICERQRFTISELLCEFQHISHTVLYAIITDRLRYHKFCARWVQQ